MIKSYDKANIFITGGSGSWGQELLKQLLRDYNPEKITIFSRGEHKQVEMKQKFKDPRIFYKIGDIRDYERVKEAMKGHDFVFHLAALKHVPVCEENVYESVMTNIIGTINVTRAANETGIKLLVDVSSDKAVDPINSYGFCKALGERIVISDSISNGFLKHVCVRGGNVLGTNGSVIPLFLSQIATKNEITITDPSMTRFFMSVSDAVKLLIFAAANCQGTEVFVMKMDACTIGDLAEVIVDSAGNKDTKITNIGIRPGEKIYEVLVSKNEAFRTYESGNYYVILPNNVSSDLKKYYDENYKKVNFEEYNSNNTTILDKSSIKDLLINGGYLQQ